MKGLPSGRRRRQRQTVALRTHTAEWSQALVGSQHPGERTDAAVVIWLETGAT